MCYIEAMGKDFYDTLTPEQQRQYDAVLEAEIAHKRLEDPERTSVAKDALKRLLEAMAKMEKDYTWSKGKLIKRPPKR